MSENNCVELSVYLHMVTDDAYLVSDTGDNDDAVWVPRSQCESDFDRDSIDSDIELEVQEWIAKDRGLI